MAELFRRIQEFLRGGDRFAAVEAIHNRGTELEIAARYAAVLSDLYWKAHDIQAVVRIGQAGILYCLSRSLAAGQPGDVVEKLRSTAKALAYDVGSFTWPGWDEPGIAPIGEELSFGQECASLNLRLAIELKKPADRVSMAHWLVGAHALSSKEFDLAERSFQVAFELLPENHAMRPLNHGYTMIARLCQEPGGAQASTEFERISKQLSESGDEDSKCFIGQLRTARRVFAP